LGVSPAVVPVNTEETPLNVPVLPTEATLLGDLQDVSELMSGICFESAFDARERIFILRTAFDHIRFYDDADNSRLCRRVVRRYPFNFDGGTVLIGVWNYGIGCTASHTIERVERDDTAKQIMIRARLSIEGECNYELLRPLWLSVPDAIDAQIVLDVVRE